jgi:uncharacterized membrane protein
MATIKLILALLFGVFMIANGTYHFSKPETYFPFIPDFLPKSVINYCIAFLEISIGTAVFVPMLRPYALLALFVMMVLFLPIHIVDIFRQHPLIGTKAIAYQRLGLQFVFIIWAWFVQSDKIHL